MKMNVEHMILIIYIWWLLILENQFETIRIEFLINSSKNSWIGLKWF